MALYKELTAENWLVEDRVLESLRSIGGDFDQHRWAARVLALDLSPNVPVDVRDLFGVARGALLYGCFFYPLFTLGFEQVLRVAESAADAKYKILGGPSPRATFASKVAWLHQQGVIRTGDAQHWHIYRQTRNSRSHPDSQMLLTPGSVLEWFDRIVRIVNALFA